MSDPIQPTVLSRGVDLDLTPEQVFENTHRLPGFFFLDSALTDHPLSGYSYVGLDPVRSLRSRGDGMDLVEGKKIRHVQGDPLTVLSTLLGGGEFTGTSSMIPFAGGAVGYLSYEMGARTTERPIHRTDDLGLPEMHFGFYNALLAYEHRSRRWYGAAVDLSGGRGTTIRKRLGREIDKLTEKVRTSHRGPVAGNISTRGSETAEGIPEHRRITIDGLPVVSTLGKQEYLDAVSRIRERIAAGDIYQANLTQRWSVPFAADPGGLYTALRSVSPAPFGIYLNTGECIIAGSSPESFLSVHGRSIETRPIKGTRPRGVTPEEDARLRDELSLSSKDRAELTMIADLERNDLGRICQPGSVTVEALHRPESFSNVHHLVSVVRGELQPGVGLEEILKATFPGGSITGAPKLKAMEILDEIEGAVRGPYTGAMGYLGLNGDLQLNVAIRTIVLTQGTCHIGVGSGIVSDSDPQSEYDECVTKARDMIRAVKQVTDGAPVGS